MPALDAHAYGALGARLWETLNKKIDEYETSNGAEAETEADVAAILTATFAERTSDNSAEYDKAQECLLTMLKRKHVPVSSEAKELLLKDAERDRRNEATGARTQEIVLQRELALLVRKSQGDFLVPAEYYENEEHVALKKKQIFQTFARPRAEALIAEATREGLAAASS